MKPAGRGRPFPKERLELIRAAMEDGWPKQEVQRTYSISAHTIDRYFPDYPVIPQSTRAAIAAGARRLNTMMKKKGLKV